MILLRSRKVTPKPIAPTVAVVSEVAVAPERKTILQKQPRKIHWLLTGNSYIITPAGYTKTTTYYYKSR